MQSYSKKLDNKRFKFLSYCMKSKEVEQHLKLEEFVLKLAIQTKKGAKNAVQQSL